METKTNTRVTLGLKYWATPIWECLSLAAQELLGI